jgi:hypothetical protein
MNLKRKSEAPRESEANYTLSGKPFTYGGETYLKVEAVKPLREPAVEEAKPTCALSGCGDEVLCYPVSSESRYGQGQCAAPRLDFLRRQQAALQTLLDELAVEIQLHQVAAQAARAAA